MAISEKIHFIGEAPEPELGFETEVIEEVTRFVSEVPDGLLSMRISRLMPEWPQPLFEIIPNNSKSASISGWAVVGDLTLAIGAAEREFIGFRRGGNVIAGATWQQELRWILETVIAGHFSQRQAISSKGEPIGGASKLMVNGTEWLFRGGRKSDKLFRKPVYRTVDYAPYLDK